MSAPDFLENEAHTLNQLASLGEAFFHLRKPSADTNPLRQLLEHLHPDTLQRTVLHSHYELADEFPVCGIHLPEQTRRNAAASATAVNSTSFHSLDALLGSELGRYRYVFLGPLYPSLSKPGYAGSISTAECAKTLPFRTEKVIAIGGMTAARLAQALEVGFSGAAFLGAIWHSPDPRRALGEIIDQCQNLARSL